ncbi:uncharacterized protein LOC116664332 [Camelus ferus]|uniref:Uncharacterized protein LOC116664332 n=1 Tax=Camelus ferus TaxID=419612 RepID=A0A8B8T7F0_CAMFR|nr:uncharacterized protein LOC116664332 [Camelus ferus]
MERPIHRVRGCRRPQEPPPPIVHAAPQSWGHPPPPKAAAAPAIGRRYLSVSWESSAPPGWKRLRPHWAPEEGWVDPKRSASVLVTRWISFRSRPAKLHPHSYFRNLSAIKAFRPTGMFSGTLQATVLSCMKTAYSSPFLGFLWEEITIPSIFRIQTRHHLTGAQTEAGKAVGEVGLVSLKRLNFLQVLGVFCLRKLHLGSW